MVCIQCGQKTEVTNSRPQKRSNTVWRRRHCSACGAVFTTEEAALYAPSVVVRNRHGRMQPFERDKLFLSIHRSLQHRASALEDATALTGTLLGKLPALIVQGAIDSTALIHLVLVALQRFDKAAATHYAAFHPD